MNSIQNVLDSQNIRGQLDIIILYLKADSRMHSITSDVLACTLKIFYYLFLIKIIYFRGIFRIK